MRFYYYIFTVLFLFTSCKQDKAAEVKNPVASVFDEVLTEDHISALMPSGLSDKEENTWRNVYIENWIRQQVVLAEAAKNTPEGLNIEQLVNDYKESLLKLQFEKKIVEERLDTTISDKELDAFYNETKEQYLLKEPMIRCRVAKVSEKKKRIDKFYEFWKKNDIKNIRAYAEKNAESSWLDKDKWITIEEFYAIIPNQIIKESALKKKGSSQKNWKGYEYFIKLYEYKGENDRPPLSFVKDQLEKIILLKRKNQLIKEYKEELYETELDNKNIKFYSSEHDTI